MSMILHRHGAPDMAPRPIRAARPAWVAVALAPIALPVAVFLALTVFHNVGEKDLTVWETVSFFVIMSAVLFTAPVVGAVMGLRAALSGNHSAAVAAGIAAAMIVALLIFLAAGSWFDTTPSVTTGMAALSGQAL